MGKVDNKCLQAIIQRKQKLCHAVVRSGDTKNCFGLSIDKDIDMLCLPIEMDGKVAGVLQLWRLHKTPFRPEEKEMMSDLVLHIAGSIKNASLYNDLQKAYEELQHARKHLIRSEKFRALGELSTGVAHDFNNLLAVILGQAQHMLKLTENDDIVEGLQAIEGASTDGAGVIERIQQFLRVEQDQDFARVDVNELVRATLKIIQPRWKQCREVKGLKFEIKTELKAADPIAGDFSALSQALTNIFFNCFDAMPEGGCMEIKTCARKEKVFIEVRDNGIGMTEDVRENIFDPFFTTKGAKGFGLGMSIVYSAVEQHRGSIKVDSAPGEGTCVTIAFPVNREVQPPQEPEPVIVEKTASILLIDDNPKVVEILFKQLTRAGHQVRPITQAKQAVEEYAVKRYDIVLTDIGMPEMTGWDIAREIKEIDPDAIIIFITGWPGQVDRKKAKKTGIKGIISKPFHKNKVMAMINTAIEEFSGMEV